MKKLITAFLLIVIVLGLCACGNTNPETTTEPNVDAGTTEPETTEAAASGYTVKVVDEGGNPISGAMVQLCAESCIPAVTNADGIATYPNAEIRNDYKVSFVSLPAGYDYVDETHEFYFADGEMEITLTLKAIA